MQQALRAVLSRACAPTLRACCPQPVLFSVRCSQEASPSTRSDASATGPQAASQDNSVKVVVRVRPFSAAEAGEREALQQRGARALAVAAPGEKETVFGFDYVASAASSQARRLEAAVARSEVSGLQLAPPPLLLASRCEGLNS